MKRVNIFIEKLQAARAERDEKDEREKAKADKAKVDQDKSIFEILAKNPEPVFETFEQAQEAAKNCRKCLPTKTGQRGCRACMGEWFEHIRKKANSSHWHMKRFESKLELEEKQNSQAEKNSQPIDLD